jgi:adenine-specific DNA-methyltransferase
LQDLPTQLSELTGPADRIATLVTRALILATDSAVRVFSSRPRSLRKTTGAFLTPPRVAVFMASLVDLTRYPTGGTVSILDPGCGTGMLAGALVDRIAQERPDLTSAVTLNDLDDVYLKAAVSSLNDHAVVRAAPGSFPAWAASAGRGDFDVVISNPPYMKVSRREDGGDLRLQIEQFTAGANNTYTGFMGIAASLLRPEGQMVFITPRSYLSGSYFAGFRGELQQRLTPRRFHVFESRVGIFDESDSVLQETVVLLADAGTHPPGHAVSISHSVGSEGLTDPASILVGVGDLWGSDVTGPWALPVSEADLALLREVRALPHTMSDFGLTVSTGPLVPFRAPGLLHHEPSATRVPLLWLHHVTPAGVTHPLTGFRKHQWYSPTGPDDNAVTQGEPALLLLRRFSPKEDERRVVGAVLHPSNMPACGVAIENHLNVIKGAAPPLLHGLLQYLTSERIDRYLRLSSGNTQISASELRRLPLPPVAQLMPSAPGNVSGR